MPGDGQADPIGVTNLLAKAARKEGVKIFEKSPVEKIVKKHGKVSGVIVNGNCKILDKTFIGSGSIMLNDVKCKRKIFAAGEIIKKRL